MTPFITFPNSLGQYDQENIRHKSIWWEKLKMALSQDDVITYIANLEGYTDKLIE